MAQLPGDPRYLQYTATDSQTVFIYDFIVYEDDELIVQSGTTTLTLTTHYTVQDSGESAGGTITLVTGATTGDIITITGNSMVERDTTFVSGGDYLASAINGEYDKLDNITKELVTESAEAFKLATKDSDISKVMPAASAGLGIKWNAGATALIATTYDPDDAQTDSAASAAAALVSENAAAADAILTAADVVSTNADVVLTNADVVLTNLDVVSTNADVVTTNADVVLTNADVSTAAASEAAAEAARDAAQASQAAALVSENAVTDDLALTNADVVSTNADVVLTNADVVLTGADVDLTNADVVSTNADVVLTNADVVLTNADVVTCAAHEAAINPSAFGSNFVPDETDTRTLGGAGKLWADVKTTLLNGAAIPYAVGIANYTHQAADGVDGGAYTTGWTAQDRPITTEVQDTIGCTLSSNTVTAPAGTYIAIWDFSVHNVGVATGYLTSSSGSYSSRWAPAHQTSSSYASISGNCAFVAAGSTDIKLIMEAQTANGTIGMGLALDQGTETYLNLILIKVA